MEKQCWSAPSLSEGCLSVPLHLVCFVATEMKGPNAVFRYLSISWIFQMCKSYYIHPFTSAVTKTDPCKYYGCDIWALFLVYKLKLDQFRWLILYKTWCNEPCSVIIFSSLWVGSHAWNSPKKENMGLRLLISQINCFFFKNMYLPFLFHFVWIWGLHTLTSKRSEVNKWNTSLIREYAIG